MARKKLSAVETSQTEDAPAIEEIEIPEAQPIKPAKKEVAPEQSPREICVSLIADYRKAQVQGMQLKKNGDHIIGFVDGTEMCKTLASPGQSSGETPRVLLDRALQAAKPVLQGMLEKWAKFSDADVLKFVEGDPCIIISNDGRKYAVDIKTGKVS